MATAVGLVASRAAAAATTTAATAATTATAEAATTATAAARLLRPRLVHRQRAAVGFLVVEAGDRRLRFLIAAHLDKAKSLRAAGVAIHDHLRRLHGAERSKDAFEVGIGDREGQIADV